MINLELKVEKNLKELNDFVSEMTKNFYIQVGILGSDVNRKDENGITNGEIGLIHETGSITKKIPERSFLRMPLFFKQKEILQAGQKALTSELKNTKVNLVKVLKKIGFACENVILDAFATGGFGKWQALSQRTIDNKKGANKYKILLNKMLLRSSVSSRVSNE